MQIFSLFATKNSQYDKKDMKRACSAFKEMLLGDISLYEDEDLKFPALIADLYPKHVYELKKLHDNYPTKNIKRVIKDIWPLYKDIYEIVRASEYAYAGQILEGNNKSESKKRSKVIKILKDCAKMF
ncbi:MAG: hypothetical protein ACU837_02490 [Gammaproteobacteria bacterium]